MVLSTLSFVIEKNFRFIVYITIKCFWNQNLKILDVL